jgi:serine protease AprX
MKTNLRASDSISRLLRLLLSAAFVLALGLISACSLMAAKPLANKVSGDLAALPATAIVDVIVQFTHPPTSTDLSAASLVGGILKKSLPGIHGVVLSMPAAAARGLANNPNVAYISPDRKVGGSLEFAEPTVNANIALQYGWNGTGVGVAVIDSGIYNHQDLDSRIVYAESFVGGDPSTGDAYGHGTHVAGIVAGDGLESTGNSYIYTFRGIAPNAKLINLRALDANG